MTDPHQCYPEPNEFVDNIRDELGTAHWRKSDVLVVIVYKGQQEPDMRFPTMLDGLVAFFRPVPQGHRCGLTLNLQSGAKGVREGVTRVNLDSWEPLRKDGGIRVYRIKEQYSDESDYYSLCSKLCNLDTWDCG